VSPVTADLAKNFQDLAPFSTPIRENLETFFTQGDGDPRFAFGPGAENSIRLEACLQTFSRVFGLPASSIHFISDRSLAFTLSILGHAKSREFSTIRYSPIDKKDAIAAVLEARNLGIEVRESHVDLSGEIHFLDGDGDPQKTLTLFQLRNGETGVWQSLIPDGPLILDATALNPRGWGFSLAKEVFAQSNNQSNNHFNTRTTRWQSALFDATSWGGPRGLYILALNERASWRNPLPTLDPALARYGASVPLTLMGAVTLDLEAAKVSTEIDRANAFLRDELRVLHDIDIAGTSTGDRLSISFLNIPADELIRRLAMDGFFLDSGSACSASELSPSHVLSAMGLLTHGNIRIRLRDENLKTVELLLKSLLTHTRALRMELL
jgi:cysteine desulfurase